MVQPNGDRHKGISHSAADPLSEAERSALMSKVRGRNNKSTEGRSRKRKRSVVLAAASPGFPDDAPYGDDP
jgi:hypothetical protein